MAQQPQPQYEFNYKRVELFKTENLGVGSYGAVCKAMCDDLPCAAKILHPALFQYTTPGTTSVMRKFEQECRLLSAIKHPHIVQYLGMYRDPESKLPVLLMELMDESLTRFLEQSDDPLPYHTEVNLCHDIAMALSYLHSNGIVHRDLSSNNVLLIAGSRAKVTDFGMVKLYDLNRSTAHHTTLTQCPGTLAYMSPEALEEPPVYTYKLDSFSLGVLGVQIMTRQFPDPGERFQIMKINDPRIPSGRVRVDVPEVERRRSHINLIDPAHPLLPFALDCLKDRDTERPSCHELCGHMSTLKASPKYTESVQQSQVNTKPTQSTSRESREREMQQSQQLQQQLQAKDDRLHTQSEQLRRNEEQIQQQQQQILGLRTLLSTTDEQLQTLQQQLSTKDEQLASRNHQLQLKEAAITACDQEIQQLRQQLQSTEQTSAELLQTLLEKERSVPNHQGLIKEPQQSASQRRREWEGSGAATSAGSIRLKWRDGGRAPCKMGGEVVAVDGSVAYFRSMEPSSLYSVFAYNSTNNKWSELPRCPNGGFSLAIVSNLLTAIGGKTQKREVTNSLLSLTDDKWTEKFPPMPTERYLTAAVCSGRSLIVAGGTSGVRKKMYLSTVEVMDTETLQWYTASSLPHPLYCASATLCGDQIYILAGFSGSSKDFNHENYSKSVFTCSLAALLQSCQPQSLVARLMNFSLVNLSVSKVWYQLADTPFFFSPCVSLHGRLLIVGGYISDNEESSVIHAYNTTTNTWEVISHMATPRHQCLVAVLPHNELVVVGGCTLAGDGDDSVEIAHII